MDAAGNRTAKSDLLAGVTSNYAYDAIYQLAQVTQGASTTESYSYDAVGNRLSSLGASPYAYNVSNQLTAKPGATYTYDANGNTVGKTDASGATAYAWDYENRLASVTLPSTGGTVTFKYDPFGRRIYKSSSSGTSVFTYDGDNLVEETNAAGGVVARYSQGLNIDEPLAMLRGASTSYYHADGLGSVTSLTNAAGALAQTYTYDSFGKLTASAGSLMNSFQYTARESDPETGLYYYRARYYDPNAGRFLSEDPLNINGDDLNFYRYVGNSSVSFYDPAGLQRVNSPRTGPPSSTAWFPNPNNPGEVTVRVYGPNGEAVTDYDYGQPHSGTDPHAHDWGKDKNGKPVRGRKRPIKPGEKVPPPTCPKKEAPQQPYSPVPYCTPQNPYDCVPDYRPRPNPIFPWLPLPPFPPLPIFGPIGLPEFLPAYAY